MKNSDTVSFQKTAQAVSSRLKAIIVAVEICFVLTLLGLWLSVPGLQESKSLWVLFLYNFPSQFLVAVVPHEPVYFYFSKFYSPLAVTAVALAGTMITEYINYSVFQYFLDFKLLKKAMGNRYVQKLISLFNKAPFSALSIAAVSPIPFYPFRFLAVMSHYPLAKYLLAVFCARSIRFYLFAIFGAALNLSDGLLLAFFGVLILITALQFLHSALKLRANRRRVRNETPEEPSPVEECPERQ